MCLQTACCSANVRFKPVLPPSGGHVCDFTTNMAEFNKKCDLRQRLLSAGAPGLTFFRDLGQQVDLWRDGALRGNLNQPAEEEEAAVSREQRRPQVTSEMTSESDPAPSGRGFTLEAPGGSCSSPLTCSLQEETRQTETSPADTEHHRQSEHAQSAVTISNC